MLAWCDAQAVADCDDGKYVVSSPNMLFVPEPPVGLLEVVLRSNFHYGVRDPI